MPLKALKIIGANWWPVDYESAALPTELRRLLVYFLLVYQIAWWLLLYKRADPSKTAPGPLCKIPPKTCAENETQLI
jgi:hypothetical protein